MKKLFLFFASFLFVFSSCKNPGPSPDEPIPEGVFCLEVYQNGAIMPDSILDATQLYYYYKGYRIHNRNEDPKAPSNVIYTDTAFLKRATDTTGLSMLAVRFISKSSVQLGVHDFYLVYPGGNTDTLTLSVQPVSEQQAQKELCGCLYPVREVKYNGVILPEDTTTYSRKAWKSIPAYKVNVQP
jgi:hypothetical protein